jgi:hypothetical protein
LPSALEQKRLKTPNGKGMLKQTEHTQTPEEQLSQLFGGYRAEWLKEQIFDLFTEPAYFPELKTPRPCVLIGGRGTGKTTVLRGLSYEGQFALSGNNAEAMKDWQYYGLYYRVNTNRVSAFSGTDVDPAEWIPLFGHYVNLLFCDLILRFLDWHQLRTGSSIQLHANAFGRLAEALHLTKPPISLREFGDELARVRIAFEAAINNIADKPRPTLSIQGGPIDVLIQELTTLSEFKSKTFFFLIDEYENFLPYQQQVINTLIKHSGELYTFKLGVKELGFKTRTTLNPTQQLISPSDYVRIDISEKLQDDQFRSFALNVCNGRIARLNMGNNAPLPDIQTLLPGLSEDQEAELLGVNNEVNTLISHLRSANRDISIIKRLEPLRAYLIKFWAESQGRSVAEVYDDFLRDPKGWDIRYTNYKHVLLYNINRRKRGIRRYYAGWDVFTRLSASNIRYLLELVDESLLLHYRQHKSFTAAVSPEDQTLAAQAVGKKNLSELEGLSVSGAQLTKLLLGLGRVFGQMAEDPTGHAPEVNQFHLTDDTPSDNMDSPQAKVTQLLESAVMHLALLRWPGTKPGSEVDTKDYDYAVHPIFSAFFVFSYRRKRKMMLSSEDVLGLVNRPRETIREILGRHHRAEEALPEQLRIFEAYFNADKE